MFDSDIARILILAQTSPNFSRQYLETVCTAGLQLDGDKDYRWIRLYPIQKRQMGRERAYQKFQWIECRLENPDRNRDKRKESYKVFMDTIKPGKIIELSQKRQKSGMVRREYLLDVLGLPVYTNKQTILDGATANDFSLCLFKPSEIVKIRPIPQSTEFTNREREIINKHLNDNKLDIVELGHDNKNLKFEKLPYKFKCTFKDDEGVLSTLSILDWEISSCLRRQLASGKSKEDALSFTLQHYSELMDVYDTYFVLGTRHDRHNALIRRPESGINPWSVISVMFLAKPESQTQGRFNF